MSKAKQAIASFKRAQHALRPQDSTLSWHISAEDLSRSDTVIATHMRAGLSYPEAVRMAAIKASHRCA